ncbi:hypothetical protein [Sporosarcina sp. Marseille-Q4943]|uniref:hypothetical protein n=1 Tax=Sporosarcina sp. Marseille-Q4943 TaxID=2942204 RepID=UPI00208DD937|nr:hypothetical protein [Sporosarcina sp. Marseille-Q4943]
MKRDIEKNILWIVNVILIICFAILVTGMINGVIKHNFSPTFIEVLSTFGGAFGGAGIAGYMSLTLFKRNVQYEKQKREKEQAVMKAIFLNDYIKETWKLVNEFSLLNYSFYDLMKNYKKFYPKKGILDYEIKSYTPVLDLLKTKKEALFELIIETQSRLESLSYNHINDYEFAKLISEHKLNLRKIEVNFEKIGELEILLDFSAIWKVEDGIANIQKYILYIERFEELLRNYNE